MNDDKKLRSFMKDNEAKIPDPSPQEFEEIQKRAFEGPINVNSSSVWLWGPAMATLATLLVGALMTQNYLDQTTSQTTNAEIAQMIWDSYRIVDENPEDPLEEIY